MGNLFSRGSKSTKNPEQLELEIKQKESEKKKVKQELTELKPDVKTAEASSDVQEKLEEKKCEYDEICGELQSKNEELSKKLEGLNDKGRRNSSEVKCGSQTCKKLIAERDRLLSETEALKTRLTKAELAEEKITACTSKQAEYGKKIDELEKLRESQMRSLLKTKGEKERLEIKISTLEEKVDNNTSDKLTKQLEETQSKLKELEDTLPKNKSLEEAIQACEDKLKKLESERDELVKDNNELVLRLRKSVLVSSRIRRRM